MHTIEFEYLDWETEELRKALVIVENITAIETVARGAIHEYVIVMPGKSYSLDMEAGEDFMFKLDEIIYEKAPSLKVECTAWGSQPLNADALSGMRFRSGGPL